MQCLQNPAIIASKWGPLTTPRKIRSPVILLDFIQWPLQPEHFVYEISLSQLVYILLPNCVDQQPQIDVLWTHAS